MNCDGVRNLLSAYLDGELSPGELLRVEEHLRRCHCCADEVDSLRQTIALVASLEEVEVPASFQVQLHERLVALGPPVAAVRRAPAAPVWQRNVRRWAMPAAAAAAALAIGLTTYSGGKIPTPGLLAKSDYTVPAENTVAINTPETGKNNPGTGSGTDPGNPLPANPKQGNEVTPPAPGEDNKPAPDTGAKPIPGQIITATPGDKPVAPVQQTNVHVQHRVILTGIVLDADKQAQINSHFLYRAATAKGLDLKVPVGVEFDNALNFVKSLWPGVQVTVSDLDLTAEVLLNEQSLAAVRAEITQIQAAPRSERGDAQLAELQRREQELKASEENYRALLASATISLEFATATPR